MTTTILLFIVIQYTDDALYDLIVDGLVWSHRKRKKTLKVSFAHTTLSYDVRIKKKKKNTNFRGYFRTELHWWIGILTRRRLLYFTRGQCHSSVYFAKGRDWYIRVFLFFLPWHSRQKLKAPHDAIVHNFDATVFKLNMNSKTRLEFGLFI